VPFKRPGMAFLFAIINTKSIKAMANSKSWEILNIYFTNNNYSFQNY